MQTRLLLVPNTGQLVGESNKHRDYKRTPYISQRDCRLREGAEVKQVPANLEAFLGKRRGTAGRVADWIARNLRLRRFAQAGSWQRIVLNQTDLVP